MSEADTPSIERQKPIEVHELFFSVTDRAGVIRGGNEVFRRIAGYDSIDEMIGKSHNIMRHPDMPRCVFKLFWDLLQSGRPVGAYVKNRAADGSYYWVYALAYPAKGGYLSVRFNPTGTLVDTMEKLYKELRAIELESDEPNIRDEAMRVAGETLLARLRELGFADYDKFFHMAVIMEMGIRARKVTMTSGDRVRGSVRGELGPDFETWCRVENSLDRMFHQVESFLDLISSLESKSKFLSNLAEEISLLALNSLVACHRQGDQARGLAVVAEGLSKIAQDAIRVISDMNTQIQELVDALRKTAGRITSAKLQSEVSIVYQGELADRRNGSRLHDDTETMGALTSTLIATVRRTAEMLPLIQVPVGGLRKELRDLEGIVRALSRVHVTGQVEAARMANSQIFVQIFAVVTEQITTARRELLGFTEEIDTLCRNLPQLERNTEALGAEIAASHLAAA
jgi:aerotaxis receptor